jgi:hypothetical protein
MNISKLTRYGIFPSLTGSRSEIVKNLCEN